MTFDQKAYDKKKWKDIKSDPIKYAEHKRKAKAEYRQWRINLKKDPARYKEFLKKRRVYRQTSKGRENFNDYMIVRRVKNRADVNSKQRANYRKNILEKRAWRAEYDEEHRDSIRSYERTKALGLRGDSCEECGTDENLVFYRDNPNYDIHGITICRKCMWRNHLSKKKK